MRKAPVTPWMNFLPMEEVRKLAIVYLVALIFKYANIGNFREVSYTCIDSSTLYMRAFASAPAPVPRYLLWAVLKL